MSSEIRLTGYCEGCPYVDLSIKKLVAEGVDEQELVDINIRCEHELACQRIAKLSKGEWQ